MNTPTTKQINVMRRIGATVDELELRNEAAGRAIEASREHRRRLTQRVKTIETEINDLPAHGDPTTVAQLQQLKQQHRTLGEQMAAAEQQEDETRKQRHGLSACLAPWRDTLDAVLRHFRLSRDDVGIPYGEDIGRMVKADVTLSGGAQ